MKRQNALTGALVADAAALGLHWLYDHEQIARIETSGSVLFRQPDANHYVGVKGYFAHAGRTAGQLSHYGESARLVGQLCLSGQYSTSEHRRLFYSAFGPGGTFNGYADRPTKALITRILKDEDTLQDPSGVDDDQMPGLCPIPAAFANSLPAQTALAAVQVISTNPQVLESAKIMYSCLDKLTSGTPLKVALDQTAREESGTVRRLLLQALSIATYQPLDTATSFGLACHVEQGLPLVWHLLYHAESFDTAVRDNIRCGGDSCGRAMVLGALAGVAFGIPKSLSDRTDTLATSLI